MGDQPKIVRLKVISVDPGRMGEAQDANGVNYFFHAMFKTRGEFPIVGDTIEAEARHDGEGWSAVNWHKV